MLFSSFTFIFFFLVVVLGRWAVPRRAVVPFLLSASYVFYLTWNPVYILLLAGSTLFTYLCGLAIGSANRRKGYLLALGVTGCLGVLATFKYLAFFLRQFHDIRALFTDSTPPALPDIVLPLGISFFLFQMLSYLIDVYRGATPERSLPRYALYISFFPQLIAGPIVRAGELLPQFGQKPVFRPEWFILGMDLLAIGFFKKVVLADNLAKWSDVVFSSPTDFGTLAIWVGVVAYAGQIYCDFSAYTDIARGCGYALGFELPRNFDLPYASRSITEFWRRWHMTLSRWLRDYLYIPLGGNQKGRPRQYLNLMLTMGLGGLWHGASWNFVFWGLYHGMLLLLHKLLQRFRPWRWKNTRPGHLLYSVFAGVSTFLLVLFGWVLFRARTMTDASHIFEGMFVFRPTVTIPSEMEWAAVFLAILALGHVIRGIRRSALFYQHVPEVIKGILWAASIIACYLFASAGMEFIYFQF